MSIQPNDLRAGSFDMSQDGPSQTTDGNLEKARDVNFSDPFPEGSNVIVIPMVQTFNGCNTPGLRITNVTHKGFKIRMNELGKTRGQAKNSYSFSNNPGKIFSFLIFANAINGPASLTIIIFCS